ncbi:C6 transcription factor asaR like protein [Verticillium longisporum]|nr:C6 transcription factor asaR like protein [Verticillium longisporum]
MLVTILIELTLAVTVAASPLTAHPVARTTAATANPTSSLCTGGRVFVGWLDKPFGILPQCKCPKSLGWDENRGRCISPPLIPPILRVGQKIICAADSTLYCDYDKDNDLCLNNTQNVVLGVVSSISKTQLKKQIQEECKKKPKCPAGQTWIEKDKKCKSPCLPKESAQKCKDKGGSPICAKTPKEYCNYDENNNLCEDNGLNILQCLVPGLDGTVGAVENILDDLFATIGEALEVLVINGTARPPDLNRSDADSTRPDAPAPAQLRRVQRSCEICHRRKIRCDKQQPCSHCKRGGVTCLYPHAEHLRRARKPKTTMADVATRISELERTLVSVSNQAATAETVTSRSQPCDTFGPEGPHSVASSGHNGGPGVLVHKGLSSQYFNEILISRVLDEEQDIQTVLSTPLLKTGLEQAIAHADFLESPTVTTIQALAIYLVCLCRRLFICLIRLTISSSALRVHNPGRGIWTIVGLVIRAAQSIGLHRDGKMLGLSPFESEIRRRLWWYIVCRDGRAAEDYGLENMRRMTPGSAAGIDMPLNVHDSDLYPEMDELPPNRPGWTSMTLSLIAIATVLGWHENAQSTPTSSDGTRSQAFATEENLLEAVEILELGTTLMTDDRLRPWQWSTRLYPQNHMLLYVLWHLCVCPDGPNRDRIWQVVETVFSDTEATRAGSVGAGDLGSRWAVLTVLKEKAFTKRAGETAASGASRVQDQTQVATPGVMDAVGVFTQMGNFDWVEDLQVLPDWTTLMKDFQMENAFKFGV